MSLPVVIPNEFANAVASIPLSQLDTNFNTLASAINTITDGTQTVSAMDVTILTAGSATVQVLLASSTTLTDLTVSSTTDLNGSLTVSGTATFSGTLTGVGTATLAYVDVNDGVLDDVDIGQVTPGAGAFTTLSSVGNTTLGDTSADSLTVNATVTSNLIFTDNTYDIGASGATRPRNLYLAGDANVGGNLNLTGAIDVTNLEVTNIKAKDGTAAATIADSTGVMTIGSSVLTTTDINGGTIDGATIGANSAAAGTFTTAAATTGNITTVNSTTVDTTNLEVTNIKAKDGTAAGSIADSTGVVTLVSSVLTTTDINGGTIDNTTIGGSTPAVGSFTQVNADNLRLDGNALTSTNSNGNIDLTPNGTGEVNITKVDIDSGAIDGTTIGANAAAAGTFTTATATTGNITTVNATTVDTTNVEVTNIKAKDGTAAVTIADSTGVVTVSTQLNVDNVNVSGNTISTTDTDGNLILSPNGNGVVQEEVGGTNYNIASQYDIGTAPNEIPLNQYLGALAYEDTETPALDVGTGITTGTGTICKANGGLMGGIYQMTILIDLTGLNSGGTAGDIIGVDGTALPCYIARLPAMTVLGGRMTCLELPAGGDTDIDLYSANEGTGVEDQAITALTETQIINAGTQALGTLTYFSAYPTTNQYLYLVGQSTSNATYTAGRFLIEIFGVQ